MVVSAITRDKVFTVEGSGYGQEGEVKLEDVPQTHGEPLLLELARAAKLCNNAVLRCHEGQWSVEGDPTLFNA